MTHVPFRLREIAQACLRRIDLKDEVMAGNLSIVRDAGVGVVHAPEDESVMLREGENFPGVFALADFDIDFGAHGVGGHYGEEAKSSTDRLFFAGGLQESF